VLEATPFFSVLRFRQLYRAIFRDKGFEGPNGDIDLGVQWGQSIDWCFSDSMMPLTRVNQELLNQVLAHRQGIETRLISEFANIAISFRALITPERRPNTSRFVS